MSRTRRVLRRFGVLSLFPSQRSWEAPLQEPPECPPGWQVGPPDFVGVGAQKAGTTWWFHLIGAHPNVYVPPTLRPELHYWDRFSDRWPTDADIATYHRYFPRPDGSLVGEKTPEYMFDYWAPRMISEAAPQARVIAILRDPIERYRSATEHYKRSGRQRERIAEDVAFMQGLYSGQVERLLRTFGDERLLVLQYEKCVRETRVELGRTYEFLGLSPHDPDEEELSRPRNASHGSKPDLQPARERELLAAYETDVARLVNLLPGLDLSLWPNFKPA